MWQTLKKIFHEKIIKIFIVSQQPVHELALGSAVGMFWCFTPLVGIQMIIVFVNWLLFRLIGLRFYLTGALAILWISNPLTMPFMYFGFYICGFYFLSWLGQSIDFITYQEISQKLITTGNMDLWSGLVYWLEYSYDFLFWPMLIGCFFSAVPLTIASYFVTKHLMKHYHRRKAVSIQKV